MTIVNMVGGGGISDEDASIKLITGSTEVSFEYTLSSDISDSSGTRTSLSLNSSTTIVANKVSMVMITPSSLSSSETRVRYSTFAKNPKLATSETYDTWKKFFKKYCDMVGIGAFTAEIGVYGCISNTSVILTGTVYVDYNASSNTLTVRDPY